MMAEQIELDIFDPPHHRLIPGIQSKLDTLLKETMDTGDSEPLSQKPYPIAIKNYQWVKSKIEKLLTAKVICSSGSCWLAPIIAVPKGDKGK